MPVGIYIRTKKTKKILSKAHKGIKLSEEHKIKIGLANKGKKYKPMSELGRQNIANAKKGKKLSKNTKLKISLASKGKKKTQEHSKNISDSKKWDKCHWWKGGVSLFNSLEYKEAVAGRKKPNKCEICNFAGRIQFDHCHKTGVFRGWICYQCNSAL